MESKSAYIIDDEISSVKRLKSLLKLISGVVLIGESYIPTTALDEIILLKPDIVFIDVEMPGMTGFELINKIRENKVFPEFVLVSAYNQYTIKAIRIGAFDFIPKPIDIDDLKESIKRFINKNKCKQKYELHNLTYREKEIMSLLKEHKTSQEIANILKLSKHTIDTHRRNIIEKYGVNSTNELISKFNK